MLPSSVLLAVGRSLTLLTVVLMVRSVAFQAPVVPVPPKLLSALVSLAVVLATGPVVASARRTVSVPGVPKKLGAATKRT